MDFDRKKLKPMWAQFWASHQVSRPTPPFIPAAFKSNCHFSSLAWLQAQQPGFNPSSLASTPAAWLQSAEFADSLTLAPTACKSDGHATQSPTLLRSYPQQLKFASIYLLSHEICYTSFHLYLCVSLLQRFFKYLCIAAKVPEAIQLAKKALEDGKVLLPSLRLNTCLAKRINCRT